MQTTDFKTSILVDQSPAQVFAAVCNVRQWWSGDIVGTADNLGDEFTYTVADVHFSRHKVTAMDPDTKVVWLVTEGALSFVADKAEWTGTQLVFDIVLHGNQTMLTFTHLGLQPTVECYSACSNAWSQIIQQSLFSLITTGKGVKIF
jgi:hypothetical protein